LNPGIREKRVAAVHGTVNYGNLYFRTPARALHEFRQSGPLQGRAISGRRQFHCIKNYPSFRDLVKRSFGGVAECAARGR
jgi:hypothetical protein